MQTWLDTPNGITSDTGYLYGGYGYISYVITGEHREYDKKSGVFKSVVPNHIFSIKDGTWGAWEVAARCSYLCLDSKNVGISGGTALNTTIGLNWYLNPNMRIMFNFVHSNRIGYGAIDGVQLRAQVDF
jgi:phosphate-selective porin OprO/OprP